MEIQATYQGTVMKHGVRLVRNPCPGDCIQSKQLLIQIPTHDLDTAVRHPPLVPHATVACALSEPIQRLLQAGRTHEANDLLDFPFAEKKIAEDERTQESCGTGEEHGNRAR